MRSADENESSYIPRHHLPAGPAGAEFARGEVQDAYIEQASSAAVAPSNLYTTATQLEQSFVGFKDESDEETMGPERLFAIIDEGLPRPNDQMDPQQKQRLTDVTYERIRRWLRAHIDLRERAEAVAIRGNSNATPLHNVCKLNNPPADIVEALVEAVPEAASWVDSHGWLPLHHACANGANEAIRILAVAYPEGKTVQDSHHRTPLHFYLTQRCDNVNTMASNIELLCDTGAAELPDVGGMLPMHYACAFGVTPTVLKVLAQNYPDSLVLKENKGRTPMHLAMVNAHHEESPGVIRFLLKNSGPEIVNARDHDGYLPLHLLALCLRGFRSDEPMQRNCVAECLSLYLGAEPLASADFLSALQDLPDWLHEVAVVSPHVRNILNKKIVQRFPTSFLIMSGYFLVISIVAFEITTSDYIDLLFDPATSTFSERGEKLLILLFICDAYFAARELLQVASLWSLGRLSSWFWDFNNWLDVSVIVLIFYYGFQMTQPESVFMAGENEAPGQEAYAFRTGVAITKGVLWVKFIYFLKSILVDFAVFVGGVYYVLQRLAAFLMAVGVILLAFAQMFFISYADTQKCNEEDKDDCPFPHCSLGESFLKVYTMMMGEIGTETRYRGSILAQILYVMYAFLVVILLSNVLIAIVTDSYEIVQNDRAAIVFWSNRLDFVAEMDAISYGIRGKLGFVDKQAGAGLGPEGRTGGKDKGSKRIFADGWRNLVQLFDQNLYEDIDFHPSNVDFWCYFLFRGLAVIFIIPLWIVAGVVTAGWLWPPQIREWLFVQKETAVSRADLEKQKLEQLKAIQNSIKTLKADVRKELFTDREEIARMKNQLEGVQSEIASDLQQVRELMTTLLDMGRR